MLLTGRIKQALPRVKAREAARIAIAAAIPIWLVAFVWVEVGAALLVLAVPLGALVFCMAWVFPESLVNAIYCPRNSQPVRPPLVGKHSTMFRTLATLAVCLCGLSFGVACGADDGSKSGGADPAKTAESGQAGTPLSGGKLGAVVFPDGPPEQPPPDIYVMNPDGSNPVRIAAGFALDWSPDGKHLAFVRVEVTAGTYRQDIFSANADGSNQVNLTNKPANYNELAWAPDGRRIAFTRLLGEGLFLMNADGSGVRQIFGQSASRSVWSPDGGRLAFTAGASVSRSGDIYVSGLGNAAPVNVTKHPAVYSRPAWSPDGKKIVFSRRDDFGTFVMNADGSGITHLPLEMRDLSWSPDRKRLAFVDVVEGEVYVLDPGGVEALFMEPRDKAADIALIAAMTRVAQIGFAGSPAQPTWSPDGQRIAFTAYSKESGQELYVVNADGSGQIKAFSPDKRARQIIPRWSPAQ